jgi:acetyl/propionyl-CoA carboxylase alpha subunit
MVKATHPLAGRPTPTVFRMVLIANRGEIACRVARTCRSLGIAVAAVYSDADRRALHVREADVAVRLPGTTSAETYLRADLLIEAARRAGADALHPGYGFLAENAGLARACAESGITFIGPSPEAIEMMGSKLESKRLVAAAGVPVLPAETIPSGNTTPGPGGAAAGDRIGYPLLVKASAGGGGKAMRIVRSPAELGAAVEACRREAAASFADDVVFLERYVDGPRHVEIQVFGDAHGRVVHLFERECSVQRRYQKVVEEAPSPAVSPELRSAMGDAAVAAARAIGYTGAGTVEFLLEEDGRFWFLEMNTRLQVEHPVTELTTGLDLVRLQLLVAAGRPLPAAALSATQDGHAIEARLYAEDPERGYLPVAGRLDVFELPILEGVRIDAGVASGSDVPVHYDPLLAKVIAWGETREEAAGRLAATLAGARLHGVATNRDLLVAVLRHPEFLAGAATTAFLDRHPPAALTAPATRERIAVHAACAALAGSAERRRLARVMRSVPAGFRNNRSQPERETFECAGRSVAVEYSHLRAGLEVAVDGEFLEGLEVHDVDPGSVDVTVAGLRRPVAVELRPGVVFVDSPLGSDDLAIHSRYPEVAGGDTAGALSAPMPGLVVRVNVEVGDKVAPDDPLVVLEAMKMEHTVRAADAGIVTEVRVAVGQQVGAGDVVAVVTDPDPDPPVPDASPEIG